MRNIKEKIRKELKKCEVIDRLLVPFDTANPDVISPSEFEEIVERMVNLYAAKR